MPISTANFKAKPSKALSRDKHRPTLQLGHVVERGDQLVLELTDSLQAVRVPLAIEGDRSPDVDLLPAAAVKILDAPGGKLDIEDGIVARGSQGETVNYEQPMERKFPDLEKAWPKDPERSYRLGFKVSLLKAIADALGVDKVEITIDVARPEGESHRGYTQAIHVRGLGSAGGEALLMPLRLDLC